MESYGLIVFMMVALGTGFLICEVFIPSAGILTIASITCYLVATFCAWRGWYQAGATVWWWSYVFGMVILLPTTISGAVYIFPRTSYGKAVLAMPQSLEELTPFKEEAARLNGLIGSSGTTTAMFSPGGMVQIDHEKFHAESDGVLIESDQDVVVVGVKGNRLIVMSAELHASIAQSAASPKTAAVNEQPNAGFANDAAATDASNDDPIDFDIPENV
ncbi:MAG: membrane-bound ClpP family serine protease [Planctomycetaceae bacterium]|jgi:membrane-bound ClpP family serine protease